MMTIVVDEEKCNRCGSCIDMCPASEPVLELGEKCCQVINMDNCMECMACEVNCEYAAIKCIEE
jgi:NAD-dependent dihydropyrimidine dehydrogenase PreA subunit